MDATDVTCDRRHVGSPSWWTRLAVGPSKRGRVTTARSLLAAPLLLGLLALTACESEVAQGGTPHRTLAPPSARTWSSPFSEVRGIHKIRHVVVPCAISFPSGPTSFASAVLCLRPRWITVPVARTGPTPGCIDRR